ncbi:PREDICTED: HAUS augmin-like complex subunit 6, partial [Tauraco erythrolophus]|uniref:HAUS augmin-like complex subunit 6 n=1 Tax=Tauraco erythrolophus TaxID=121530 RepID=UPI0005239FDF
DLPFSNILQVARAVMSDSPQSGEGKGMSLEDLISSLASDPFLTRRQIPRTPENLLTEIRSSWRNAVQTESSSGIELTPTEVMKDESPMDARPIMQKVADSSLMHSIHASPVPGFNPPMSERKSQLSSTEFRSEEQISHIIESSILETSEMRENERPEEHELECSVLFKNSVQDTEEQTFPDVKSVNASDVFSENNSGTNVQPSDHSWSSLMDKMLHWNASLLRSGSPKTFRSGILSETFPEELDTLDLSKSESSESDFDVIDSAYVTGLSKNKGDTQKSKLDLHSLFDTHKALQEAASGSEEELHETHSEGESVSFSSEKRERDELWGPRKVFCLDEEFSKTPSPISLNDRKYSLSLLLESYQHLEEMASMVHEIPLDLIRKLEDKEQLNEKPSMKEPSSEQNL